MPIEKSAGAIVFYKNGKKIEYLLLCQKIKRITWGFPKGLVDKGEKLEETAKREIEEEASLKDIEFVPGFKESIKYFYKWKGKNIFKVVTFFLVKAKTKTVKLSYEHINYKWLSFEEALKQITFDNAKEILKKANQFLKEKYVTKS